jgi:hypothetical protein
MDIKNLTILMSNMTLHLKMIYDPKKTTTMIIKIVHLTMLSPKHDFQFNSLSKPPHFFHTQ